MALSEHEQEMLDQIEFGLRATGPKLTAGPYAVGRGSGRPHRPKLIVVAAIAVGFALVLAGLISKAIVISVLGFLLIIAATMAAASDPAQLWSRSRQAAIRLANPPSEASQRVRKPGRHNDQI